MKKNLFLIVVILLTLQLFHSPIYSKESKVKSIDGVEISFDVIGEGDIALVFIHGWSCDKSYWNYFKDGFAKDYKVVAIDLAGHGASGLNRENYTVELFGEDVTAVVNHLMLNKVILIGHSMGGAVIIEAAKRLPGKVLGLVGVDTYQSFVDNWSTEQKENFLKSFTENFVETTKRFVKSMFPQTADSNLVKKVAEDMSSAPPEAAVSSIRNVFFYDPIPTLKEINLPIISINCDMYPVAIEENKKIVKDFDVKFIKGVGHFLMLEKPGEFNELLSEAINKLSNRNL
ncbi:MAG: alpha/beta hydrolase [Bacteroidota bacterium]